MAPSPPLALPPPPVAVELIPPLPAEIAPPVPPELVAPPLPFDPASPIPPEPIVPPEAIVPPEPTVPPEAIAPPVLVPGTPPLLLPAILPAAPPTEVAPVPAASGASKVAPASGWWYLGPSWHANTARTPTTPKTLTCRTSFILLLVGREEERDRTKGRARSSIGAPRPKLLLPNCSRLARVEPEISVAAIGQALRAGAGALVAVFVEAVAGGAVGAARGCGGRPGAGLVDVVAEVRFANDGLAGRGGCDAALVPRAAERDLVRGGAGVGGEAHPGDQKSVGVRDARAGREVYARAGALS